MHLGLAVVLVGGLALRLYGIRHGLPYIYHPDEAFHFTSRAVAMFADGMNPHYFQNPSAFTYLVHLALRVQYGGGWPLGDFGHLLRQYAADPSEVYEAARQLAALLCMLGVAAVYAVGRRLWGAMEGLAAAAVLAFAFLPVAYSRYAVTDVGVLLPVAVAIYATVRAHEDGRARFFLLAGAAAGLAVGFKYTVGLVIVPLLVAAALRARSDRAAIGAAAGALVVAGLTFLVTTPYFLPDLDEAVMQLRSQSYAAAEPKLGQQAVDGHWFYIRSLTWGLGWGAAIAALAGAVLEFRRNRTRLLLLALFP
ncbi:MAG: glycosyltransferase family 39 protein, partial [Actinobacteria bacterium]|nr:glycosyltransferase family 39 protein [Actinomycetota bacterium]